MKARVANFETLVDDVRDLRAFAITSDLKSLTKAARILGESKATTSRRITRLETALGVALLRRSPRTIEMTDEGALYRARVAEVLELLGDANAAAQGARAIPSGQLRVAAAPGLSEALAPLLARFSAAFPKVAISVHVAARFVDLEVEQFDVALRATAKLPDSTSLVAHRIESTVYTERIVVAAPSYLEAHPAPRRVEDLVAHRMLGQTDAPATSPVVFTLQRNNAQVTTSLPVAMATADIVLIRDLALEGAGVGIIPRMLVQRHLDRGRLVHLLRGFVAPSADLYLVRRGGRFVPPKVRAFVEFAKRELVLVPAHISRRSPLRR
jgi:DNA-binding transcriptional LysR family regulator